MSIARIRMLVRRSPFSFSAGASEKDLVCWVILLGTLPRSMVLVRVGFMMS